MITRHDFADKSSLADELAEAVAANLQDGITQRGAASLAVSGGGTPKGFFAALSQNKSVDWEKVTITLVDERWVNANSDRSNARLVAQNLMQHAAAKAKFVPLYSGGETPDAKRVAQSNKSLLANVPMPFDAVILGMGNDGHTASFFPGGDTLSAALSQNGPAIAIRAPGAGEARITLTLPTVLNTKHLYLHIEGAEKAQTLERALALDVIEEMPVRAVLSQNEKPVQVYWCP